MLFDKDFLPLQPSRSIGNQALIITNDKESNDDLDLPQTKHLLLHTDLAKTHCNRSQQFPKPLITPQHTHSSVNITKNLELFGSPHPQKLPSVPLVLTFFQPNKKRKRRAKSLIDAESDSGNERFYIKCQKGKLSMAKAVVK